MSNRFPPIIQIMAEYLVMRERLIETEEICDDKLGEPLRWSGSGERIDGKKDPKPQGELNDVVKEKS